MGTLQGLGCSKISWVARMILILGNWVSAPIASGDLAWRGHGLAPCGDVTGGGFEYLGHHHLPLATISSVICAPWLRKEDLLLRIYFFYNCFYDRCWKTEGFWEGFFFSFLSDLSIFHLSTRWVNNWLSSACKWDRHPPDLCFPHSSWVHQDLQHLWLAPNFSTHVQTHMAMHTSKPHWNISAASHPVAGSCSWCQDAALVQWLQLWMPLANT